MDIAEYEVRAHFTAQLEDDQGVTFRAAVFEGNPDGGWRWLCSTSDHEHIVDALAEVLRIVLNHGMINLAGAPFT